MWSNLWKNCFWEIALSWLTLRGAGRSQSRQMFHGVYNTSVDRCVNIKPQSVDASVPADSEFLFFWTFSRMLHIVLFFSVKQQVDKEFWLKAASQGRPFPPPKNCPLTGGREPNPGAHPSPHSKQHFDRFSHFSTAHGYVKQTDSHTQTHTDQET